LRAVFVRLAKPRRPFVRARAPELASRRAQATNSAAGIGPDRFQARSAAFVVRTDARRARSVPRDAGKSFGTASKASISSRRIAIPRLGRSSASRGIEWNEARGERELAFAAVCRVPGVSDRVFPVAQARRRPDAPPASSVFLPRRASLFVARRRGAEGATRRLRERLAPPADRPR